MTMTTPGEQMTTAISPTQAEPRTITRLMHTAARRHSDRVAVRSRAGGQWRDVSFDEAGALVDDLARGLIALGVEPGDRVGLLSETRPAWTFADLAITAAGAVVVPIYATSSPDECEWILGDSQSVAVVCEDASQVAKVLAVRDRLPDLNTIVAIDPAAGAIGLGELRESGTEIDDAELESRAASTAPGDPCTIIYTSGTTGPPKGCVITHANLRAMLDSVREGDLLGDADDVTYLYLPLAHVLARIMQHSSIEAGGTIAYFGGDTRQVVEELAEVAPTFLPSVPRIFEKVYALVTAGIDRRTLREAVRVGGEVQDLRALGATVPPELDDAYQRFDSALFSRVRAAFGGRVRKAVTGAAPIAEEILEFFWACGVPVLEGYGMTETTAGVAIARLGAQRFGTVGRPIPGVEVRIAGDGEILVSGPNVFAGYYGNAAAGFGAVVDGWLHTGDLGSVDEDGFLRITGRKKDLIITAGGKNITPANLESDMRRTRWVSQAVMHGDRRPYPVMLITLDEDEIIPWAAGQGLPADVAALAEHPQVLALIQVELDRANGRYARAEQVKRFAVLPHDLSQESGELTPTLKVKRAVVDERYADVLDALYAGPPAFQSRNA
jgi:long-chain acyl-CoA synthetase